MKNKRILHLNLKNIHKDNITCLKVVNLEKKCILTASNDGYIKFWDN